MAIPRRILLPLLSSLLGTGLALALGETLSQLYERRLRADEAAQTPEPVELMEPNASGAGSFRLKPNLDLKTTVERSRISIKTNRHGMRWREVEKDPSPGRRRVAVLGDSFTFGCWADDIEGAFVSVLERNISEERFEVLNFGVSGYGVDDMELQLEEQVLGFSPSYVVIVVFTGNDFRDTHLGLRKFRFGDGTARLDGDVLAERIPEPLRRAPFQASPPAPEARPLPRVLGRFALFRLLAPFLGLENLALDFTVSQRFLSYSFWSQVPFPKEAQQAVDETLEALRRIDRSLRQRRVRLALAALPTKDQVYSRREFGPDFDVALPQVHLQTFATREGIPYIDLLRPLRERVGRHNGALYRRRDTHLNNEGHRVVGEALAAWFRCCVKQAPWRPLPGP